MKCIYQQPPLPYDPEIISSELRFRSRDSVSVVNPKGEKRKDPSRKRISTHLLQKKILATPVSTSIDCISCLRNPCLPENSSHPKDSFAENVAPQIDELM